MTRPTKAAWVFWLPWGIGLVLWIGALAFTAPLDLSLSQSLVDVGSTLAVVVARFGEWPGWLMILFSVIVLRVGRLGRSDRFGSLLPLAQAVALLAIADPLIVTQAFKLLWGRVRFIHLAKDLSNYTPFWRPAGVGVGTSFPSGHVAMSMVPSPLPFFLASKQHHIAATTSGLIVLLLGATVSLGRIVAGKHYLTDTLFSFGFALLLAPLLLRWIYRRKAPK